MSRRGLHLHPPPASASLLRHCLPSAARLPAACHAPTVRLPHQTGAPTAAVPTSATSRACNKQSIYMIYIGLLKLAQLMLSRNRKRISPKSLPQPNFGWVLFCLSSLTRPCPPLCNGLLAAVIRQRTLRLGFKKRQQPFCQPDQVDSIRTAGSAQL